MWSRITSPRPRARAGGGSAAGGVGPYRRNSSTASIGHASRQGSVKGRDYDHRGSLHHGSSPATGSRSASIRDHRRRRASRGYAMDGEDDDVEWGDDGGGGGCGGAFEWEDHNNAREAIKVAAAAAHVTYYEDEVANTTTREDENDEVIASLDSLTSSHQSLIMGDRANRVTIVEGMGGESAPPPPPAYTPSAPMTSTNTATTTTAANNNNSSTANTSFPRLIPSRYRIRDFLLGDFSFNDDGERYVRKFIMTILYILLLGR